MRTLWTTAVAAFSLATVLLVNGCSDTPTGTTGTTDDNPVTITGTYFIQAKVNGKTETMQEQEQGTTLTGQYYSGHSGYGSGDDYPVTQEIGFVRQSFTGTNFTPDPTYLTIRIALVKIFEYQPYGEEYDMLLPSTGTMNFGSEDKNIDGVEVRWVDASGTYWSTALGAADQTGSKFTVTSRERIVVPPGYVGPSLPRYNVKGTFNCKLYDGKGSSIDVTNGTFSLQMVYTV